MVLVVGQAVVPASICIFMLQSVWLCGDPKQELAVPLITILVPEFMLTFGVWQQQVLLPLSCAANTKCPLSSASSCQGCSAGCAGAVAAEAAAVALERRAPEPS